MSLLIHQFRYGLRAYLRNRRAVFFTLLFPLILLVLFSSLFAHGDARFDGVKLTLADYYVPSIIAMSIVTSTFIGLVGAVAGERELGILKRRRATPVPAWALVGSRALISIFVSLCVALVLLLVAAIAYGVEVPAGGALAVALAIVVGSASFCCLGYAVSCFVDSRESAQPIVQATVLPLYFISGVWVPTDGMPEWLQRIAKVFPIEHLADALHRAFLPGLAGSGPIAGDLAALAIWAAIGVRVATRRFSWLPARSAA
jgi:ABC-2 type transport system permease protein